MNKGLNKEMITDYINAYGGLQEGFGLGIDNFVYNWERAKSKRLFDLFGGELILEKEVKVEKSLDQIAGDMSKMSNSFLYDFNYELGMKLRERLGEDNDLWDTIWDLRALINFDSLAENRVLIKSRVLTRNSDSKKLKIEKGQKLMNAIKQVIKFYELDIENSSFEEFRLEHSRILNDKMFKGTLCLSIHPLDYMTMSDNNHSWESCMSWVHEGCYRAGTLECINCENTIVAYLKSSDSDFKFAGNEWNSKKWRALFHITDEIILSNKHYPYRQDKINTICLDWIKELSEKNLKIEYLEDVYSLEALNGGEVPGMEECVVSADVEFMYCDLDYNSKSFLYIAVEHKGNMSFDLGGTAYCLECGERLDSESGLICSDCSNDFYCECCEETCYGEYHTASSGEIICDHCLEEYYSTCDECGETLHHTELNSYEDGDDNLLGYYCDHCHAIKVEQEEDRATTEALLVIKPVE